VYISPLSIFLKKFVLKLKQLKVLKQLIVKLIVLNCSKVKAINWFWTKRTVETITVFGIFKFL